MASHSSYPRNGSHPRSFYSSQAPMSSSDPGPYLGSARRMGPPTQFDFPTLANPPQPIEVDMNSSRTLPSPSASAPPLWDNYSSPGLGALAEYGPYTGRPLSVENQTRATATDPLQQWYTSNDGPWIPKEISNLPEERLHSRARAGNNRVPMQFGNHYRQPHPSDAGSIPFGVPPSDSGYATRRSDENASIFSTDVNDRDQDCHSLAGNVVDYQSFQGLHEVLQQRDPHAGDSWTPLPSSSLSGASGLVCPTCQKPVKTRSELKKHDLRHTKPFVCKFPGCTRTDGFSTTNDLDRHIKSKHPSGDPGSEPSRRYRCHVPGCKSREKSWPRLDNFRSHLKRIHSQVLQTEDDFDKMIKQAEFWDRTGLTVDQGNLSSQTPPLPDSSRAIGPLAQKDSSVSRNKEPNWKPIYPDVIESTQDLSAPKGKMLQDSNETTSPAANTPASDSPPQETVQPLEVFGRVAEIRNSPSSLGSILLAPVGASVSPIKEADWATPRPAAHTSKSSPHGKGTRHKLVSASDVTITEVITSALAGANTSEDVNDHGPHQDSERSNLPHDGKTTPGGSWPAGQTGKPDGHINQADSQPVQEDSISLHQKKAIEVLKTLRELGYIVKKDPSHTPRGHNPGSVASSKSENLVTCQTCKRFTGRPCELKKHMKRHSRPYGCTFSTCNKTFGSKNDWKRHENSQHFHLEIWRCAEEKLEGIPCAKACYRRQTFQDHLKKEHDISDEKALEKRFDVCRIGRNCQARFWCGFCIKLIDLTKKGLEAWTERFDHIDDHFMGRRDLVKQGIQDWVPVDGDKPKGDVESPLDLSPGKESQGSPLDQPGSGSSHGGSPEAGAEGGSPTHAINLDDDGQDSSKRKCSAGDDDSSAPKRPRITARNETTVYCCECNAAHNPKFDQRCTMCAHLFCNSCTFELRPPSRDES